ncbi:hypothetical protein SORBI_3006G229700 [Sorghum bicolor]|nr:hypothetical protein SORBI_3006G229700 [Sorghum bicolor]
MQGIDGQSLPRLNLRSPQDLWPAFGSASSFGMPQPRNHLATNFLPKKCGGRFCRRSPSWRAATQKKSLQ